MAGTIRCISKINLSLLTSNVTRQLIFNGARTIYTESSLGLDNYRAAREQFASKYRIGHEAFRTKMEKVVEDEKEIVFTEDLKAILHLTEKNPYELDLLRRSLEKYISRTTGLKVIAFKFGPVVMRALHYLNQPDMARDLFMDARFDGFFCEYTTFMILLDLLYENQRYQDVCDVYDKILKNLSHELSHPKLAMIVVALACYKLDTPESFEYVLNIWRSLVEKQQSPIRRFVSILGLTALKQNQPEVALELASSCKFRTYITIRCIRVMALAKLGRLNDIMIELEYGLTRDPERHQYYRDTVEAVEDAVAREGTEEHGRISSALKTLKTNGYIYDITLSEHIQNPIETGRPDRTSNRLDREWVQPAKHAPYSRRSSIYEDTSDAYGSG